MQTDQTAPEPQSVHSPEPGSQHVVEEATARRDALREQLHKAERDLRAFIAERPLVAAGLAALAGAATAQLAMVALRRRPADVEPLARAKEPLLAAFAAWLPRKSKPSGMATDPPVPVTNARCEPAVPARGARRFQAEHPTARSRLEQAQGAARQAAGRVQSALARAADSASLRVEGQLRQAAGQARQNYAEAMELAKGTAVNHPIATLAVAAGIGSLLVGLLSSRR